jgi:hypothetical protein
LNVLDFDFSIKTLNYDAIRENMGLDVAEECTVGAAANLVFSQVVSDSLGSAIFFWMGGLYALAEAWAFGSEWVKPELKIAELTTQKIFSTGLVMLTFPFAPMAVLLTPIVWYINFKLEKIIIMKYYGKPKREMRGGKNGIVFAGFMLTSVCVILLPVTFFFLSRESLYATSDCGPYQDGSYENGFEVLKNAFTGASDVGEGSWSALFQTNYLGWAVCMYMFVKYRFTKNSVKVNALTGENKIHLYEMQMLALRNTLASKETTIKKLKQLQAVDHAVAVEEHHKAGESDSDSDSDDGEGE